MNAPRVPVPELRKGDEIILRSNEGHDFIDLLLADPVKSRFGEGTRFELQLAVTGLTSKPAHARLRRVIQEETS